MSPSTEPLWRFLDSGGEPINVPREWTPAFIEVSAEPDQIEAVTVEIQGRPCDLAVRKFQGKYVVVAPWNLSAAGLYLVEVEFRDTSDRREVFVGPSKITRDDLQEMVTDIETHLAPTIALSLQQMGSLGGLQITPPGQSTFEAEVNRVKVAVNGDTNGPGLVSCLRDISVNPHRMLQTHEPWVKAERARRPSPARLAAAIATPGNLSDDQLPIMVADRRVEHTYDVYENRLLKFYVTRLTRRIRRLQRLQGRYQLAAAHVSEELRELGNSLRNEQAAASFLSSVTLPRNGPAQLTMVLLQRPEYRAMLESYRRFQRHVTVTIDDSLLRAPLRSVPDLYETWGTMKVSQTLLAVACEQGFTVEVERFVRRQDDGLRLVTRGFEVKLLRASDGTRVHLKDQAHYGNSKSGLHSITYAQRPDIAIEVTRGSMPTDVYLFDPKYKLSVVGVSADEHEDADEVVLGGPKKVDIDKMHSYRDAIRRPDGSHAVRYAAILYPGETRPFATGEIEAIGCRPSMSKEFDIKLRDLMIGWLSAESIES